MRIESDVPSNGLRILNASAGQIVMAASMIEAAFSDARRLLGPLILGGQRSPRCRWNGAGPAGWLRAINVLRDQMGKAMLRRIALNKQHELEPTSDADIWVASWRDPPNLEASSGCLS
jgi:hypothetical protein